MNDHFLMRISARLLLVFLVCLSVGSAYAEEGDGDELNSLDGKILYERYCSDCHRTLKHTDKPDRSARRIRSAIEHMPVMNHLNHLADDECQAISEVIKSNPR